MIINLLCWLKAHARISYLDFYFANWMVNHSREAIVKLLLALLSHAYRLGHSCFALHALPTYLSTLCHQAPVELKTTIRLLSKPRPNLHWKRQLQRSQAIGTPIHPKPVMLDQDKLYLHRMWKAEQCIKIFLYASNHQLPLPTAIEACRAGLLQAFPDFDEGYNTLPSQLVALVLSLESNLLFILGGPGTGKTTTISKLVFFYRSVAGFEENSIALTAPTGKAAARLTESLASAQALYHTTNFSAFHAVTVHALLYRFPEASYPILPLRLLIIDEASMLDTWLFSQLLKRLDPMTRLILVGDPQQLSAVHAGSILVDLVKHNRSVYSPSRLKLLSSLFPKSILSNQTLSPGVASSHLSDFMVELHEKHRFQEASELCCFVNELQCNDYAAIQKRLQSIPKRLSSKEGVYWSDIPSFYTVNEWGAWIREIACMHYQDFYQKLLLADLHSQPDVLYRAFMNVQILCSIRMGWTGCDFCNHVIDNHFAKIWKAHTQSKPVWYPGRAVLITVNAPEKKLYNGDIGMTYLNSKGILQVYFPQPNQDSISIAPERLPKHELAYALTVHKSQGSEFPVVVAVLAPSQSGIMNRQLCYTAMTRAKQQVYLYANQQELMQALRTSNARMSGIQA